MPAVMTYINLIIGQYQVFKNLQSHYSALGTLNGEDNLANTRHRPNVGPMLGQRRRRWPNISPALSGASCLLGNQEHCIKHRLYFNHKRL